MSDQSVAGGPSRAMAGISADPLGRSASRTKTTPIRVDRSTRIIDCRGLTSIPAGFMTPVMAFGLLREDRVRRSQIRLNFEMLETVELLINPVHVRAQAWLVPYLAFERFQGSMDILNRSYMKQPIVDGGATVPYLATGPFARATMPIYTYLGKHAREGQTVNLAYQQAYNHIWNHRARNRSPDIALRTETNTALAKAFWISERFADIVPDFDQATIEGEVPLTVADGKLPVKGIGIQASTVQGQANTGIRETGGTATRAGAGWMEGTVPPAAAGQMRIGIMEEAGRAGWPDIFAELAENGITVSLANIELARRTQAFAALRKQYAGHQDDYIIDLLMNGITVPDQFWTMPQLLADQSTIFGMNKRYSTTADDLTASVVNGGTYLDLNVSTPRCPTGGVVMITVEVCPEQLYERQSDPFMHITDQDNFPEFMRDTLDPEKVEIVQNQYVDMDHDTPTGTFGYTFLNSKWSRLGPGIGGKFYRPTVDAAFDEDRQRIWAVETQNPTLAEDFYLVTNLHQKPFVVTNQDNFEAVHKGMVAIEGNTVFGRPLIEASDDYNEILAEAPIDTIDKGAAAAAEPAAPQTKTVVKNAPSSDPSK